MAAPNEWVALVAQMAASLYPYVAQRIGRYEAENPPRWANAHRVIEKEAVQLAFDLLAEAETRVEASGRK